MGLIIETEGLRKTFKRRRGTVEAVRGVNLQVREGEVFGFLGPNGAGKTTTTRMLATLLQPSGGSARVAGHDLLHQPHEVRRRIGYVSQAGGVDPSATGRQNLLLQARLSGMSRAQAHARADELLEKLELTQIAGRVTRTYSGGQRQRLALALGLAHRPPLLFLDEPTAGLDPQARARLWDEVHALRTSGTTVFLTTHYLEEADALCDRLAIIDHGQIVAEGSPAELKQQVAGDVVTLRLGHGGATAGEVRTYVAALPFTREVQQDDGAVRVYVERGSENLLPLLRTLDEHGLKIHSVELASPSLDDVFLRKTGRSLREAPEGAAA